jgi:hypothetical protein
MIKKIICKWKLLSLLMKFFLFLLIICTLSLYKFILYYVII